MSNQKQRNESQMTELSLDSLDVVVGGSAMPMGLGASHAATLPTAASAIPGATSPTGYQDHFGIHAGTSSVHAAAAAAGLPSAGASPMPMGLGGDMPTMNAGTSAPIGASTSASPIGAAGDGSDHGAAQSPTGAAGEVAPGAISAGQDAHAHEHLGVNALSAFDILDAAAQDAVPMHDGQQTH